MATYQQMTMEQQNRAAVALEAKRAPEIEARQHAFAEGLNGTERVHWLDSRGFPLPVLALAQGLTALDEGAFRLTSAMDVADAAWLITFMQDYGAEVRFGPAATGGEAARQGLLASCLTKLAWETGEPSPRRQSDSGKVLEALRAKGFELYLEREKVA